MSDKEIEQEIIAKGKIAPRVTPDRIEQVIAKEEYHRLTPVLTVCVLTLANGFTVTGESACASPENFDEEIGNKIARENARQKIWPLEGYFLKEALFREVESKKISPSYQTRVIEEKAALDEKIGKLKAFVDGPAMLSGIDRSLLLKQLRTMDDYSTTLGDRIGRLGQVV